jgi:hypothetical protein
MRIGSTIRISTTGPDGKKYTGLNQLLLSRRVLGANAYKATAETAIRQAYQKTGKVLEQVIAKSIGASQVREQAGSGAIFDYIVATDEGLSTAETKAITVESNTEGVVTRAREISVASSDITLTSGSRRRLVTGLRDNIDLGTVTADREFSASEVASIEEVPITNRFIKSLIALKNDQGGLKNLLNGKSKAAVALRKNFQLKSSDIRIIFRINNQVIVSSIGWTWADIYKNPKAVIKIKEIDESTVTFNIVFTEALVRDALNKSLTQVNFVNKELGNTLNQILADNFAQLDPTVSDLLSSFGIRFSFTYDSGSLLVSKGIFAGTAARRSARTVTKQQFVSGIQWTVLTQRRLGDTMLKLGNPEPPNLKQRSGRFIQSVRVLPNYRTSTLQFLYNPLYESLEKYGYKPDLQVKTAIREVAQQLYARRFNIVKA